MDETDFLKAIKLIKEFSLPQLQQAKQHIFALLNEMENEKRNLSNEVRRANFYFAISDKVKQKRIKYIDEIILPHKNTQMVSEANDVFPDLRVSSLKKIKAFRRERERLSKTAADHKLRVRQSAKLLSVSFVEVSKLEKQYEQLSKAETVSKFFWNRGIAVEGILETDSKRYYDIFRKEGV